HASPWRGSGRRATAPRGLRQRAKPEARRTRLALRAPAQRAGRQGSSENWSLLATLLNTARIRRIGASFRFEYEIRPPILRGVRLRLRRAPVVMPHPLPTGL